MSRQTFKQMPVKSSAPKSIQKPVKPILGGPDKNQFKPAPIKVSAQKNSLPRGYKFGR
jgi:hypothetical protein